MKKVFEKRPQAYLISKDERSITSINSICLYIHKVKEYYIEIIFLLQDNGNSLILQFEPKTINEGNV